MARLPNTTTPPRQPTDHEREVARHRAEGHEQRARQHVEHHLRRLGVDPDAPERETHTCARMSGCR